MKDQGATAATCDEQRGRYYERIAPLHLYPLWEQLKNLIPQQPSPSCVPAIWHYEQVRPLLLESAGLISAAEALRRVLILENPGLKGQSSITQTLYGGLQLIMPGEIAPAHRHTQSALRFIVEGRGAYTAVNGERTFMEPGDFVTTPSWNWHDHGNEMHAAAEPVIWLDGLDVPLVRFLDVGFAEDGESDRHAIRQPEGTSFARYGHNMAPIRSTHSGRASPVFNYPYSRTREALRALSLCEEPDMWDGWKLQYVNPTTGGAPLPTIATFMQLLPAGFLGKTYRTTEGTVFSVVEGSGTALVDGKPLAFQARDVFVVPPWKVVNLTAGAECVLFSYSDRPVQQALGFHREELFVQ